MGGHKGLFIGERISSNSNLGNILIPSLLYQVEYDWKERAWAGRKKVKDTWGLVV